MAEKLTKRASPSGDANEKKTEEVDMGRNPSWIVILSAAIVLTALYSGNVLATPSSGFMGTTLAVGRLGEFDVLNHLNPRDGDLWFSMQKTKGSSDAYVQSNIWQPGGHTGWHTHPGHSLILVTAGTVTVYDGDDPTCKPAVFTQGMGFVDPGGDHVHLIRNEGTVPASTIAFQLLPAGAPRRIDAPDPKNCHF